MTDRDVVRVTEPYKRGQGTRLAQEGTTATLGLEGKRRGSIPWAQ